MSDPRLEELKRAQQLLDEDKYQETLDILTKFEKRKDISKEDLIEYLLIRGELHFILGQFLEVVNISEQAYQLSKDQGNLLQIFDALFLKGMSSFGFSGYELPQILRQLENIYLSFKDVSPNEKLKRKANLNRFKGIVSEFEKDYDKAIEYHERSLNITEKLGNKADVAFNLLWIAGYYRDIVGDLSKSLIYSKKSLTFNEIRRRDKYSAFFNLGYASMLRGDLDQALEYTDQMKKISDEINHKGFDAWVNYFLGFISRLKGDLYQALGYFNNMLKISDECGLITQTVTCYFNIIRIYIDMGSNEEAIKCLKNFKQFNEQTKIREPSQIYQISKGLVLKASSNIRDRFKAEIILKDAIESTPIDKNLAYTAMTHLCDLLSMELRRTNDLGILNELNPFIAQFIKIAEHQESFWRLVDGKILQAKLALIQMNMGETRRLLTEAQVIADEHGLGLMAQKISNEHDKLLKQLSEWEKFKEEDVPVSKRIELSSFDDVIERLLEKSRVEPQKAVDEDPLLLLIIAEGGVLLFSYPFREDWERDNELFGSFLSTITSFSQEFLNDSLDRVKFGQHTVIMKPVANFSIFYVFKGQTYLAKQKFTHFTTQIQNEKAILETLDKYAQSSQVIEIKDFPFLKAFINGTFVANN